MFAKESGRVILAHLPRMNTDSSIGGQVTLIEKSKD